MEKRKNKGSAVIEMTLLMPVILAVFYLYISLFLFLIESGKDMRNMTEILYSEEEMDNPESVMMKEQGKMKSVFVKESIGMFEVDLELHRNDDSVVENIRRWQLATDTVHKRGNE